MSRDLETSFANRSSMVVSVILAARAEGARLGACLAAIDRALTEAKLGPERAEILLALSDHDSTDSIASLSLSVPMRILSNPKLSAAAGLNRALDEARGELVVRVDARSRVRPDHFQTLLAACELAPDDCLGGRQLPTGTHWVARAIRRVSQDAFSSGAAEYRQLEDKKKLPQDEQGLGDDDQSPDFGEQNHRSALREVDTVYLGAWPRRRLAVIGGFDESFRRNQDDELAFRWRSYGGRVTLCEDLVTDYVARDTLIGVAGQYFRFGYWKPAVLTRHSREARGRHLAPPIAMGLAISAPLVVGLLVTTHFVAAPSVMIAALVLFSATLATWLSLHRGLLSSPAALLVAAIQQSSYGLGFLLGVPKALFNREPYPAARTSDDEGRRLELLFAARDQRRSSQGGAESDDHEARVPLEGRSSQRGKMRGERRLRRRVLREIVGHHALKGRTLEVLEIGCGHGDFREDLAETELSANGGQQVGVDLRSERLKHHRSRHPEVSVLRADATGLPFPAASFDLVVMATVLSGLGSGEPRRRVLGECRRVLRNDGMILIYDLRRDFPGRSWSSVSRQEIFDFFPHCEIHREFGMIPASWKFWDGLAPRVGELLARRLPGRTHALSLHRSSVASSRS